MEIERNPPAVEGLYLRSLNLCFPGWGDTRAYDWAFKRHAGGPKADQLLLRDGGELLAGSAVSYRTLVTPTGSPESWGSRRRRATSLRSQLTLRPARRSSEERRWRQTGRSTAAIECEPLVQRKLALIPSMRPPA